MPIQGLVTTYQTTTTAVEVDEQIDRLRETSNVNLALSFPKSQAWMLMRSRMQPTCIIQNMSAPIIFGDIDSHVDSKN